MLFLLKLPHFDPQLIVQALGQRQHPINKSEQLQNRLPRIAPPVQTADQVPLRPVARLIRPRRLAGAQMRLGDDGEGIGRRFQFRPPVAPGAQADHGKAQPHQAAPAAIAEFTVSRWMRLAQHRQADHRAAVEIIRPVVIDKHPPGEIRGILALDLDMHQDVVVRAVLAGDSHQGIGPPLAQGCIPHHLLQFLIEQGISPLPVNAVVGRWKEKFQKRREILRQHVFPGRIVIIPLHRFTLQPPSST